MFVNPSCLVIWHNCSFPLKQIWWLICIRPQKIHVSVLPSSKRCNSRFRNITNVSINLKPCAADNLTKLLWISTKINNMAFVVKNNPEENTLLTQKSRHALMIFNKILINYQNYMSLYIYGNILISIVYWPTFGVNEANVCTKCIIDV